MDFSRGASYFLDEIWCQAQYPIAAIELGQGDFESLHHHFVAVGRKRHYIGGT